jgi:NADH:ubiquinone reductase (non-electrogenic)
MVCPTSHHCLITPYFIVDNLQMKGTNGTIFAIGDCTATAYAPTAQAANQQGAYLARCFQQMAKRDNLTANMSRIEAEYANPTSSEDKQKLEEEMNLVKKQLGKVKLKPFQYSHQGSLAYIGSEKAIADLPFLNGNASLFFLSR